MAAGELTTFITTQRRIDHDQGKLSFVVCALAAGCAGPLVQSGSFKVGQKSLADATAKVKSRASFELNCKPDQIELVVLAVTPYIDTAPAPTQIGASGCGNRGVYVENQSSGEWILNSTSAPAVKPQ